MPCAIAAVYSKGIGLVVATARRLPRLQERVALYVGVSDLAG